MTKFDEACSNPSRIFKHPMDILADTSLSRDEKIKILESWAYDEKELAVAEEENMSSAPDEHPSYLAEINKTLKILGADTPTSDTKHG